MPKKSKKFPEVLKHKDMRKRFKKTKIKRLKEKNKEVNNYMDFKNKELTKELNDPGSRKEIKQIFGDMSSKVSRNIKDLERVLTQSENLEASAREFSARAREIREAQVKEHNSSWLVKLGVLKSETLELIGEPATKETSPQQISEGRGKKLFNAISSGFKKISDFFKGNNTKKDAVAVKTQATKIGSSATSEDISVQKNQEKFDKEFPQQVQKPVQAMDDIDVGTLKAGGIRQKLEKVGNTPPTQPPTRLRSKSLDVSRG